MSEFNQTTTVSNNKLDNNLCMRLAEAIVDNFNKLFESSNIVYCIDFENATKILDIFL